MISFYKNAAGVVIYRDDSYLDSLKFVIEHPATASEITAHPTEYAAFTAVGQTLTATFPAGTTGTIQFTRTLVAPPFTKTLISGAVANSVNSLTYQETSADSGYNVGVDFSNQTSSGSVAATALTMAGPTTGVVGLVSSNYSVALSPTGSTAVSVTVTPSDSASGGTCNPTSLTLSTASPSGAFTYTPASAGAKSISITNNGGLANPGSLTYTATTAVGLRPVTDRGALPNFSATGSNVTYIQARTAHIAHDVITKPVVEWTTCYPASASEDAGAVANIISSSVEYPAGTFTQLTYNSGSVTAVINGTTILSSDAKAIATAIPDGATFWVWINMQFTSTQRVYYDDSMYNNASGEAGSYSGTALTDQTMTGGIGIGSQYAITFRPVCIRDMSAKQTAYLMGDSRVRKTQGVYGHVGSIKGRTGEAQRAVGARMACINGAVSGDSYGNVIQANMYNVRAQLASRCDIIIDEYGINDLGTGVNTSLSTFANYINTMRALTGLAGKPYYRMTITPRAISTNLFVDTTNQTATTNASARSAINDAIRNNTLALNAPMAGYFETADAVESARNSGLINPLSNRQIITVSEAVSNVTMTSNVAKFSASDVGRLLYATNANHREFVATYISPTQVTLRNGPGVAIAVGDLVTLGIPSSDGLHYTPEAEILMAAHTSWNQLGTATY